MIVVHQMAKVASRSWIEAARIATQGGQEPIHCHFVMPRNLERIRQALHGPLLRKTIGNMLLPNALIRHGERAFDLVRTARETGTQLRVITGMREPVARSISLIVFWADFYGDSSRPLSPKSPPTTDFVISALRENWASVLQEREPDATFAWSLWYLTRAYRTWFSEELLPAFEVDIGTSAFHREEGVQRLSNRFADVLAYRVEDMHPSSPFHDRVLKHANAFLSTSLGEFPNVNTSQTRRSAALSEDVRRRFRLPSDMLDAIYDAPVVRHFYSRDEIRAFKERWAE